MEKKYCHIIPPVWTVRHPDMAAAWLTETVRQAGYEVFVLDLNVELYQRETRPMVKDCWKRLFVAMDPYTFVKSTIEQHIDFIRSRLEPVVESGCRIFGILLLDGTARFAGMLSRLIKEMAPDAHIIVGGTGATSLYRYRRRYGQKQPIPHPVDIELEQGHQFDTWVLGEGEQTLLEVLSRLGQDQDPGGLRGTVLTRDGPFAPFKERALIKDLDSLPHPTFEGFDLTLYDFGSLPFQLTRGCAFARCSHCGLRGYSRGFRARSPEHAVAELKYNIQRYGVKEFHFTDLGVNGDLKRLEAFCDQVLKEKLEISWQSFVQIRGDMTRRLLEKIVASGCGSFNYGFESGSDLVLRSMRKPYSSAEAARVLRMTYEAGGRPLINIMCGHPDETEEEFQQTLDFLSANARHISMVASVGFTSVPIHSPLLDECDAFGVVVDPLGRWVSSDGKLTQEVRNQRVHRVCGHLRRLNIPCYEAFWEVLPEERGIGTHVKQSSEGAWLRITDVQMASPEGIIEHFHHGSDPLMIHVAYISEGTLSHVVWDLRILDAQGRVVLETPAASEVLRQIHAAHRGWLQMVLFPFDLPPGLSFVEVRAFNPLTGHTFDHHLVRTPLVVLGTPREPIRGMTPLTWIHYPGELPDAGSSLLRLVRLTDSAGDEPRLFSCGQPLTIQVETSAAEIDDPAIEIRLRHAASGKLHLHRREEVDLRQARVTTWQVEALLVPPGLYELEVCILSAGVSFQRCCPLQVQEVWQGERPPVPGYLGLDATDRWEVLGGTELSASSPSLQSVELVRDDDADGPLHPGDPFAAHLTIAVPGEGITRLQVRAWVTAREQEQVLALARASAHVVAPGSTIGLQLRLRANLLDGDFRIRFALWDPAADAPLQPVWTFPLSLRSTDRRLGGGLVFAPHSLELSELEADAVG